MQRVLQDHSLLFWNRAARANKLYKANDCTPLPRRQPRLDPLTTLSGSYVAEWPNLRLLTLMRPHAACAGTDEAACDSYAAAATELGAMTHQVLLPLPTSPLLRSVHQPRHVRRRRAHALTTH